MLLSKIATFLGDHAAVLAWGVTWTEALRGTIALTVASYAVFAIYTWKKSAEDESASAIVTRLG
jgi:hypothetical protein